MYRDFHRPAYISSCVTPSVLALPLRDRISNLLSISYALRPRLRSRLTLGGLSFPRNPWASGECVSRTLCVTYADILASIASNNPSGLPSSFMERSSTDQNFSFQSRSFGSVLSPLYFRRRNPRPVSCYALFKGWLLLSQPPGCPGIPTSFSHLAHFGDLSCRSGLFPFRPRNFSPVVSLLSISHWYS